LPDTEPVLEFATPQPPPRYHRLITVVKGSQTVKFKFYAESTSSDITQTIRTRFGLGCSQSFVLTDEDGFDVVIDGTLETGTYKLAVPEEETKDDFVLYYFPARGRAELARFIFAEAKVPYTNKLVADWEKEKVEGLADGTLPFGQVPRLTNGKVSLVQSNAIARYLARKFNLYGSNSTEHALVDQWIDTAEDIRSKIGRLLFGPPDEKIHAEYVPWAEALLGNIEKAVVRNGSKYIVGNQLTVADLALFDVLEKQALKFPELLSKFPALKAHFTLVSSRPNLAAYLATKRFEK